MFFSRQLGRYHLLDRIAFGGMAEIFRAKTFDATGNEHLVAIKRVLRALAEDDAFLQMLVDEAKIASVLNHPNIARVYEFSRAGEEHFLAMEYVDGKDLRSVLERCKELRVAIDPVHSAYIMASVLEALHSAHIKTDGAGRPLNIVHRDVSPSNIIISYEGTPKLCDFGIAKATLSRVQTRVGVVKGKVRYMSPEQTRGVALDGRSDAFSAASVLYELLCQHPAFKGQSEMELVVNVREARYVPLSRHHVKVPRELQRCLRKAMSLSLSERHDSAAEFAAELRTFVKRVSPNYQPADLGRFLRKIFANEIETDLRKLEQYVLGDADPNALGDNLIDPNDAHAGGSQFTPLWDTKQADNTDAHTRIIPRMPEREPRRPKGISVHEAPTQLHDANDSRRWVIKPAAKTGNAEITDENAAPSYDEATKTENDLVLNENAIDERRSRIHQLPTKILPRSK